MDQFLKVINGRQKNVHIFLLFWLLRIISVSVVQTFFVPDEYYQSLEVAHSMAFGYGHITWEWKEGIRSYAYPLIFVIFYKLLELLGLDTDLSIALAPRILQSLLTAYSDYCFYQWTGKKKWSIFIIAGSWFWFYMGSRTLINTFETCLTTIALSKFSWIGQPAGKDHFLWIVAILFAIRPTSVIIWLPLCLYHILSSVQTVQRVLLTKYLPIFLSIMLVSIGLDSFCHGSYIVTPYNFLHFNIFNNVGEIYGTHSWYWYLLIGLPFVLGIYTMPLLIAIRTILKKPENYPNEVLLICTLSFALFVLSCIPHKEFRFLTPLLPIMCYILAKCLALWSGFAKEKSTLSVIAIFFFANIAFIYYSSFTHQRGTLDVMRALNKIVENTYPMDKLSFLFLMPCHSTPLYSHLHAEVETRFLTCEPNLNNLPNYVDEADQFYNNSTAWLKTNYPESAYLPSHVICFDILLPEINDYILASYHLIEKIFHCDVPVASRIGKYVYLYERNDF